MRARGLLAVAIPVALAGVAGPTAGAESPEGPRVTIPAGRPVSLDGLATKDEWGEAAAFDVGAPGSRLLLKQSRGTLLVGFVSDRPWPANAHLLLFFRAGLRAG